MLRHIMGCLVDGVLWLCRWLQLHPLRCWILRHDSSLIHLLDKSCFADIYYLLYVLVGSTLLRSLELDAILTESKAAFLLH
jgi:hypothetical protein